MRPLSILRSQGPRPTNTGYPTLYRLDARRRSALARQRTLDPGQTTSRDFDRQFRSRPASLVAGVPNGCGADPDRPGFGCFGPVGRHRLQYPMPPNRANPQGLARTNCDFRNNSPHVTWRELRPLSSKRRLHRPETGSQMSSLVSSD